jgi:predicted Na+-dependent transporter
MILTTAGVNRLGGLRRSGSWVQALGAGQRNIAAVMVVATMNFGSDEIVMVVVYSLITLLVMIPLALELGKRHAGGTAESDAATGVA